jgi:arginase family enzyme
VDRTLTATRLVALLCRTSDRGPEGAAGAEALAHALGELIGEPPRIVGSPGEPRTGTWEEDLRDSRGCILEAGGQVDDALAAGEFPILLSSDCTICLTTIPAVLRHRPRAAVLWLDAHGDFNTPETTPSGFLGGMCLAGACGLWDAGLVEGPALDPTQVVMCGVRDLDGQEGVLVETRGVDVISRPSLLAGALAGREVFVHLDCDVLDPSIMPARFEADGGLSDGGLRTLLTEVAEAATLVGCEITAFGAPEMAEQLAEVIEPLLPPQSEQ